MTIQAAELLREGLLSDYRDAYFDTRNEPDPRVSLIMNVNAGADGRTATSAFVNPAPHPRYQPSGQPIHEEAMDAKSFVTYIYPYGLRIPFDLDDVADDRTNSLRQMAAAGGANHRLAEERALFDLLSDTTAFIPNVPNAADGTAIFSASTRFEKSTGNSLTVSSWNASGPAARAALWTAHQQFRTFKDGKGQPMHRDRVLDSPMLVIHAVEDMDVIAEALHMGLVAYANSTSNAGVDNVLVTGGRQFIPWPTSRVTSGEMFCYMTGRQVKPFLFRRREDIQESYGDLTNSEEAQKTNKGHVQWRQRFGVGVGVVDALLKVSAS